MRSSGRKAGAVRIQVGNHQHNPHHAQKNELEDAIMAKTGVTCSVRVTPDQVKIHAASYSDFILAKAAIKDQLITEITRG